MPIPSNKKYDKFWDNKDLEIGTESKNNDTDTTDVVDPLATDVVKDESKKEEPKKEEPKIEEKPKKRKYTKKTTTKKATKKVESKSDDNSEEPIIETKEPTVEAIIDKPTDINSNEQIDKIKMAINSTNEDKVLNEVITKVEVVEVKEIPLKYVYDTFLAEQKPFRLLYRGNVIFNSMKNVKKDYPTLSHDGFTVFGKKYPHRGIRIEKI